MSSAIQNILESTIGDGARSTKFDVMFSFTNPSANPDSKALITQVKTSSFPSKSNTTIDFKFKGRSIPIRGQVKYAQTWECTFYLTEDHTLKHELENWLEALDERHNYSNPSDTKSVRQTQIRHNKDGYTQTAHIYQRDFNDERNTALYTLFNIYPTEISPVQINYESKGELLEFTCTFTYSHYNMATVTGNQGNFIDQAIGKAFDAANGIVDGTVSKIQNYLGVGLGLNPSITSSLSQTSNVPDRVKLAEAQTVGTNHTNNIRNSVSVSIDVGAQL